MPTTTTPFDRHFRQAASSRGASSLHGRHHEAQKFSTTAFPRSDESWRRPGSSSRSRSNAGACGWSPRRRASAGPALGVAHDPPDEHREQREDDRDRQHLAGAAQADGHHAETMNTGVPSFTLLNSHSADGIAMRMQPWEAE